jgi:stringent starvation protein B
LNTNLFKPYLLRALYECSAEYNMTPHIVVNVDEHTQVPESYIKRGEIVLNISMSATHALQLGNEWVTFSARFQGMAHEILIPIARISRFFVPEGDFGAEFVVFETPKNISQPHPVAASVPGLATGNQSKTENKTQHKRPSHLTVVK